MLNKTDIAREFIRRFPGTPNRTLARIMRKERGDLFSSVDNARIAVRNATGAHGAEKRRTCKSDTYSSDALSKLERELNAVPAGIPDETTQDLIPYVVGTGDSWLMLADAHIPEHSKATIETAVHEAKKDGIKNVLFMGDAIEHSHTSRHAHDPAKPDIYRELKDLTAFIKFIRETFKGRIIYKSGNHEDNLKRYVWQQAAALAALPCLEFNELVGFQRYGIEYAEHDRTLEIGKLAAIHGHEYKGGSPAYPAQWLMRKARSCAVTAHFHKADTARGTTATGAVISCWSIPCLRSLTPEWCPKNEWNHGFAKLRSHSDGNFEFENRLVLSRGEVVPAISRT